MNNNKTIITLIIAASLATLPVSKNSTCEGSTQIISASQPDGTLDISLRKEVEAAIDRSLNWLASQQKDNGSWSNEKYPALTALPLQAFIQSKHPKKKVVIEKAKSFILGLVQKDGGIYTQIPDRKGGGLSNYNTAICMTSLHALNDRSLVPIIQKARKFIAETQHLDNDIYKGGFGYDKDTNRDYTDLLNTFYSVQAMKATEDVEDLRKDPKDRVDLDWGETVKYIESMQNKPSAGKDQEGGFFYKPGESKAGTLTNNNDVIVFRSYGSITYAGLLSLLYSNVPRDDTRVQSAFDWAAKHWTLKENPGMGAQGQFFFYNILSKSLNAFGVDAIPAANGSTINWKVELARKLINMQKIDASTGNGYWINEKNRFWEGDPILVTAYSILALELL